MTKMNLSESGFGVKFTNMMILIQCYSERIPISSHIIGILKFVINYNVQAYAVN